MKRSSLGQVAARRCAGVQTTDAGGPDRAEEAAMASRREEKRERERDGRAIFVSCHHLLQSAVPTYYLPTYLVSARAVAPTSRLRTAESLSPVGE